MEHPMRVLGNQNRKFPPIQDAIRTRYNEVTTNTEGKIIMANTGYYIYSDRRHYDCIGMYDEDGYIYNGRVFFNGQTPWDKVVGRIDSNGYVYKGRYCYESNCVGMIDRNGNVYRGRSFFNGATPGTASVGYVSGNGEVYDKPVTFTDRAPAGEFPVAYLEYGENMRTAGAAALLLLLGDAADNYDSGATYSGGYSGGGGAGGGLAALVSVIGIIAAIVFGVMFLTGQVREIAESRQEREQRLEQTRQEVSAAMDVYEWENISDTHIRMTGYFGEYGTTSHFTTDFSVHSDVNVRVVVKSDSGLEVQSYTRGKLDLGDLNASTMRNGESFTAISGQPYVIHVEHLEGAGYYTIDLYVGE